MPGFDLSTSNDFLFGGYHLVLWQPKHEIFTNGHYTDL
ncbi:hypothetical protein yinte0001_23880 [Yersinia intermedia ATCC 29909]|nr:hypothetical protein yinte0001_23880 [Yersinia intermedia ATCC 29909]